MTRNRFATVAALALAIAFSSTPVPAGAQVKTGDLITSDNASKVETLLTMSDMCQMESASSGSTACLDGCRTASQIILFEHREGAAKT
jgi:hypothetical protein